MMAVDRVVGPRCLLDMGKQRFSLKRDWERFSRRYDIACALEQFPGEATLERLLNETGYDDITNYEQCVDAMRTAGDDWYPLLHIILGLLERNAWAEQRP